MMAEAGITVDLKPAAGLTTAPAHQTNYSDKLQEVLAKSQQLSQIPIPSQSTSTEQTASQPSNATARPTGFSDRMREVLARTQRY
jgi:hypothetical protein